MGPLCIPAVHTFCDNENFPSDVFPFFKGLFVDQESILFEATGENQSSGSTSLLKIFETFAAVSHSSTKRYLPEYQLEIKLQFLLVSTSGRLPSQYAFFCFLDDFFFAR